MQIDKTLQSRSPTSPNQQKFEKIDTKLDTVVNDLKHIGSLLMYKN